MAVLELWIGCGRGSKLRTRVLAGLAFTTVISVGPYTLRQWCMTMTRNETPSHTGHFEHQTFPNISLLPALVAGFTRVLILPQSHSVHRGRGFLSQRGCAQGITGLAPTRLKATATHLLEQRTQARDHEDTLALHHTSHMSQIEFTGHKVAKQQAPRLVLTLAPRVSLDLLRGNLVQRTQNLDGLGRSEPANGARKGCPTNRVPLPATW